MFGFNKKKKDETSQPAPVVTSRFTFVPLGFHGDLYLMKVVDVIGKHVVFFAETGTNVGSTLSYFAKKYPSVKCVSCEPNPEAFELAQKNAGGANVELFNEMSQEFLERLKRNYSNELSKPSAYWLDAHGYGFDWPLIHEMQFIMTYAKEYYILIDDFEVPGIPEFGFDVYQNQVCSHDYIKSHLPDQEFYLYYPTYKEKTSTHHPLRGWGLYTNKRIDWKSKGIDFVREEHYNAGL